VTTPPMARRQARKRQITAGLPCHYGPKTDRRTAVAPVMSHHAAPQKLFDLLLRNGRVDCLDPRAGNLDLVHFTEISPNGGVSEGGLRVHEAGGRTAELSGKTNHRRRIFACAVMKIGCDCSRADQNKRREHLSLQLVLEAGMQTRCRKLAVIIITNATAG
jgi:hypothetical protein